MSGAFEVAAGAFAVVGVADVLVRAGRDLYSFLCDIEDAPENAKRLCDSVAGTVSLAGASRKLLLQLKNRTQPASVTEVIDTLNLALKALDREVKSLKILTAKCKGSTKRWSNIRYALSEQRINKALGSLEQSKSLLTSALTLGGRELTGVENEHIEKLMQQSIQQIDSKTEDLTQTITAKFDANERSFASHLDSLRQRDSMTQTTLQNALHTKLDIHHQELTTSHKVHEDSLTTIQREQARTASSQNRLLRTAKQTSKRTTRISQDLKAHARASDKQHQTTRDLIITTFKDVQIIQAPSASRAASSGRQIVYAGERRDLIMPALYYVEKDLAMVFDRLFTDHCHDVSPSHIALLQSEFQHLIASATQEKAASYAMSTATPFDAWVYPGETKWTAAPEEQNALLPITHGHGETALFAPQKRRNHAKRVLSFQTSKGTLQVRLPRRGMEKNAAGVFDEVSFSLNHVFGGPFVAMNARFTRLRDRCMAPRICAQLQIFLPLEEEEQFDHYIRVIAHGTIQEFDRALRDGTISPYRFSTKLGTNALFYLAAACGRADVIRYLDSQGVGYSRLQQTSSLSLGISSAFFQSDGPGFEEIDAIVNSCNDPSVLLADAVMTSLLLHNKFSDFDYYSWSSLSICLQRLQGLHGRNFPEDLRWNLDMVPDVVRFLLEVGAGPNTMLMGRLPLLGCFLVSGFFKQCISAPQGHYVRKQILSALIEAGADVSYHNSHGYSVADIAWEFGHWDVWCEALQENGKSIMQVDKSRPQGWAQIDGVSDEEETGSEDSMVNMSEDDISDADDNEDECCATSEDGEDQKGSLEGNSDEEEQ